MKRFILTWTVFWRILSGVKDLCGVEVVPQEQATEEQDNQMWDSIRKVDKFYYKLEPMPGAIDGFQRLYGKYGNNCEILSAIPKEKRMIENAGEDKAKWVHEKLGTDIKVNIVSSAEEKSKYCKGKQTILIDDLEKNIKSWEKCGGTGIRFQNWNQVLEEIERIASTSI